MPIKRVKYKRLSAIIITMLFCITYISIYAQYENVWAFGRNAGIDFNVNPPQAIETGIFTNEGCATICDVNGKLLFYTDGTSVWNRNHNVMPNGTNLTGLNNNITASTSQGALIVPMPGSLHKYYLFSMGCWECGQLGRLSYSIVDMSLNNGLGDVVTNSSGMLLDNTFTEHMTAVAGNNCDIWLMTLSRQNNGQFQAYNISVNGINPVPVVSFTLPLIYGGGAIFDEVRGYIDISPNRRKLAIAKSNVILYDFDPSTGSLTSPVILINQPLGAYGVAFSPDNTKLYIQDVKIDFNNNFALQQFDLSSNDSLIIVNSRNTIHTIHSSFSANVISGAIKRGPDGKIYCARVPLSYFLPSYIGIINKPNLNGIACEFVSDGLLLKSGTFSMGGLPNSNSSIFEHHIKNSSYTIVCNKNQLSAQLTNGNHYLWNDGLTTPTRSIDTPGIYWVKYQAIGTKCVEEYVDSFKVLPYEWEHYTSSIALNSCWQDTITLNATHLTGANYLWQDGITGISRTVTQSGTYLLTYHEPGNECKNYADSFVVDIPEQDYKISFVTDSFACQNQSLVFNNTSDNYYNNFTWYFGNGDTSSERNPDYRYPHPGSYEIMLTGYHNDICPDTAIQTVIVDTQLTATFSVQPDEICQGEQVIIKHQLNDSSVQNLQWQYGDNPYSSVSDEIQQHSFAYSGTIPITLKATYRACPEAIYTRSVTIHPVPLIDLGKDSALCLKGTSITLQNRHTYRQGDQYLWSTGTTTPAITISQTGLYWLQISNAFGCWARENIEIVKDCYIDMPNSFTPNGDGINDYFFPRQLLSQGITYFHMEVFNRWGQLLFVTTNPEARGWDGRFNGKEQPGGVYIYRITLGFKNGKEEQYNGNVTLIR